MWSKSTCSFPIPLSKLSPPSANLSFFLPKIAQTSSWTPLWNQNEAAKSFPYFSFAYGLVPPCSRTQSTPGCLHGEMSTVGERQQLLLQKMVIILQFMNCAVLGRTCQVHHTCQIDPEILQVTLSLLARHTQPTINFFCAYFGEVKLQTTHNFSPSEHLLFGL
jgi:hypothetical protein